MKPSLVALIVIGAATSQRAAAQAIAPAGVVNRPVVADTAPRFTKGSSFLIRSLTGGLGLVAGVAIVNQIRPCECDAGRAAAAGIVLGGASFGASAPKLSGRCSFGARILPSTAGSFFGSLFAGVIGSKLSDEDAALVAIGVGSVLGASTALIGC